jgi:hypothetical protein
LILEHHLGLVGTDVDSRGWIGIALVLWPISPTFYELLFLTQNNHKLNSKCEKAVCKNVGEIDTLPPRVEYENPWTPSNGQLKSINGLNLRKCIKQTN